MAGSSVSSFSSTSLSEDDRRSISQKRKRKRRRHNDKKRHSNTKTSTTLTPAHAAPSDWEQLRAHFQFVLPSDDNNGDTNNQKYGSNWQERMVQNYHAHLYKEYVLADLSRVLDIGKIGLRWRTEKEVADGRGFRSCGNLMCNKGSLSSKKISAATSKDNAQDREAYASAVKRHMGIAVPENGGKVPLGVLLPAESTTLEAYLQSCQQQMMNQMQPEQKKKKRKHQSYSLKEQEKNEVVRLEALPYGIGLHDYEVDFVYVEQQMKKRELVKVRLCLRCAPLLFIANGSSSDRKAPAVKAREARELAARNHASSMTNASVNNTNQSIDSSIT